ncbi:hypothetical protein JL720_10413 [Aureococcus anophagefferens]|nr:hypothetical protein JL720_10413 [Aureococcus anophagefferens]
MDALPDDVLGRVFGALLLDGDGGFDDDGAGAPAPPWQRSNVGAALRLPPHTNLYRLRERCRAAGVVALVCGRTRLRAGAPRGAAGAAPPLLALGVSAVDDAGLAAVAAAQRRRPSLTSLSVYGCGNVTGAGLGAFGAPLPLRRLSVGANRRVAAEHVGALAASARATLRELDASRVSRSALGGFEAARGRMCADDHGGVARGRA